MSDTILHTIVKDALPELSRRKREMPLSALSTMAGFSRETLPFADALIGVPTTIIAEIKRRSPSKGLLRESFDVCAIAKSYQMAGAAAISVLTESNHFGGQLGYLQDVRSAVTIPILRKDFIVDPYQLFEARAFGADAALLIATLLDRSQIEELLHAAKEAGITCLVELYDASELDKIDFDHVSVLGVNNRDLRTFEVDTDRAPAILSMAPKNVVRVAESGLSSGEELAALSLAGIDAALIGESFMIHDNPGSALKDLTSDMQNHLAKQESNES
jgi:indole-3-glycerol phosphate synthase